MRHTKQKGRGKTKKRNRASKETPSRVQSKSRAAAIQVESQIALAKEIMQDYRETLSSLAEN